MNRPGMARSGPTQPDPARQVISQSFQSYEFGNLTHTDFPLYNSGIKFPIIFFLFRNYSVCRVLLKNHLIFLKSDDYTWRPIRIIIVFIRKIVFIVNETDFLREIDRSSSDFFFANWARAG